VVWCVLHGSLTEIKLTCLSRVMTGIRDHTARLHAYKFTLYSAPGQNYGQRFYHRAPAFHHVAWPAFGETKILQKKATVGTGRSHTQTGNGFLTMLQYTKWRLLIFTRVKFACILILIYILPVSVCIQLSHVCCFAAGHTCVLEIQISSHPVYTRVDS